MTPVVEYIKNVGKSFVYTTVEQFEEDMPATKEFMDANEELFKDTYHSIMNIRRTKNRFTNAIKKTALYEGAEYAFDNIVDSFRTGKFNDPYRQAKADAEMIDFGDFESGDSDMSMSNFGTDSTSTSTGGSMDENTRAVLDSSAANAKSISTATLESAKYVAGVSKANTALLFNQTIQMNQTLSAGFSGLTAGMDTLNRFNTEVVQTLAQNATNYFQKTTDILRENNAMFKEFLEMQRNLYRSQNEESSYDDVDSLITSKGMPNLKQYGKIIIKNLKEELDDTIPGLDLILDDPKMLKSAIANPLSVIPGMMLSVAMGPMLKTSLSKMNDTISGLFSNFLAKMSFNADDFEAPWYKQILGRLFRVNDLDKNTIDTRNTKNGPTPFDFQTKRAITEVIPGYLARIEAGITGSPAKLYDDRSGKWTDIGKVKENFESNQNYTKMRGFRDLHNEMNSNMATANWDNKTISKMQKNMEKVANQMYKDNGHFNYNGDIYDFASYYGLNENEAKLFLDLFNSTSKKTRNKLAGNVIESKLQNKRALKYEEKLGQQSLYRQLFTNGFDDTPTTRAKLYDTDEDGNLKLVDNNAKNVGGVFNLNNMSDSYGATVFDYLRSIDINTGKISGDGPWKNKGNIPPVPPNDNTNGADNSDIDSSEVNDLSKSILNAGKINQDIELQRQLDKNKSNIGEYLVTFLNTMDEIVHFDTDGYKGNFGTKISENETLQKIVSKLDNVTGKLSEFIDSVSDSVSNAPGYANGASKVTKSGLTFLSKGEIVIPNESEEQRELDAINEEKIRQKFINQAKNAQMFAEGGEAINDKDGQNNRYGSFIRNAKGWIKDLNAKFDGETKNVDSVYERVKEIIFGDSYKETKETVKKVEDEIKDKVPNIATGGVLGAIGGTMVGGPLVGAVLGSALGIASNTKTVQSALFGEKILDENGNETGERKEGLFSQETQKVMKKYMPDMKKFGIGGALLGMFTPFGILGGALMGSAIGFIKNNEQAQETLFGKNGLIDEDTQKKFKKYFPSAAKGGGAALLLGLAGGLGGAPLLGVAALGAGVGLVTSTDEFKDELLGKTGKDGKRHGGVLEEFKKTITNPFKKFGKDMTDGFKKWFKDDIAAPVVSAMAPMGKQMAIMAKSTLNLGKKLVKGITSGKTGIPLIDNIMGSKAGQLVRKYGGKAGKNLISGSKWLLSRPSALIGEFGDRLREHQIETGTADYMSADERLEYMAKKNKDYEGKATDELLSSLDTKSLEKHSKAIAELKNGPDEFDKNIEETRKNLGKDLSKALNAKKNNKDAKEIMRLINKNDLKGAQEYLESINIPRNKKAELSKLIQEAGTSIKENEYKRDNYNETRNTNFEMLSKIYGKKINADNIDELDDLVNKEYRVRTKEEEGEENLGEEDKLAEILTDKSDEQISELQLLNDQISTIVSFMTGAKEGIVYGDQRVDLKAYANSGKEIMDRMQVSAEKQGKDRIKYVHNNLFGKKHKLSKDMVNKIKNDNEQGSFVNELSRFSKTDAFKGGIDPNYFASLDPETRQLYLRLSEKGYIIENIDQIVNFSDDDKAKLIKMADVDYKFESLKDIIKLHEEDVDKMYDIIQAHPEMSNLPQKTLINFVKKHGYRFLNDQKFRNMVLANLGDPKKFDPDKIQKEEDNLNKTSINRRRDQQRHLNRKKFSMTDKLKEEFNNTTVGKVYNKFKDLKSKIKDAYNEEVNKTQEEKEAESQQPEDVEKHSWGALIKAAGGAIVSKGETILKAGGKLAKNWAKNKLKEKWENSAAGKVYKKASNLKATVSNAVEANGENNGMEMTKGSDGRSIAANTKENADIKKAEQQKNAMQQDNNDTLHQLVAINEQIAANTTPPDPQNGGGLLGSLLTLLGTFLFGKFKKAYEFLKNGWKFIEGGMKGLKTAVESIGTIGTKLGEAIGKAGEMAKVLMHPFDAIGKLWNKTAKIFKAIGKVGKNITSKNPVLAAAGLAVGAYAAYDEISAILNEKEVNENDKKYLMDNGYSEEQAEIELKKNMKDEESGVNLNDLDYLMNNGYSRDEAIEYLKTGKEPSGSGSGTGNNEPGPGKVNYSEEDTSLLGAAGGALTAGLGYLGFNKVSDYAGKLTEKLMGPKTPPVPGAPQGFLSKWGGRAMKGLSAMNLYNTAGNAYDFVTGDTDTKLAMLNQWNDKSLFDKTMDIWMTADGIGFAKNLASSGMNMLTGGGKAAAEAAEGTEAVAKGTEAAAKGEGLLAKGLNKAKDIGKNIKGVFNHVGGFDTLKNIGGELGSKVMDKAGGMAENMKTIISKVTELIDKTISKVSSLVTEKFGKAMLKIKDIIIKRLSNPATYKMILKAGGKALAKLGLAATGVGAIVTAGWMAVDGALAFYDGFNDAVNLLGLSGNYDPTMDVKMLAGCINALFDGSIVCPIIWEPREFFDLCLTEVGPIVGITKEQLEEDCKKADENPPSIIDNALSVAKYTGPLGYAVSKGGKWLKDTITESETYKAATEFVGEKANQFYEGVEELGGKAKETLNNGIDIAYQFYEGMKEKATEVIDSFTASITEGINSLTDFIGKSWTSLKDGIANGISSVITNLGNLGSSILDSIKNSAIAQSAGRLWNNAKNTYNNAKNWVKEKWNGTKDLWNKAKASVRNSSLGRRIFGSGKWGTGSSVADIDSIASYEDCMEILAGIRIDTLPEQDRPSSEDDIPTLKKKARSILSKFGKGKWGRGNKETDAWNIFHSQLDPTNSMGFNASGDTMDQSMADSGCGPVSAANIGSYFGKHIDSKDAASYALKNGYKEKNGGTKDGFFGDFLGKYGIGTKHIAPGNAKDSLRKGKPVILMGKDKSNNPILDATGQSKTPFGSNPHYVVATGLDKNDNMIIQDPESRTPNKKYKASDVMNKSSIAMDASTGMGRWGRGPTVDEEPPFGSVAASIAKQAGSEHPELFWAQMMVETGGPEKAKADTAKYGEDYNYGGFTWYPSMGEDHKGVPRPASEGGYYAKFSSDAEYAEAAYNKIFKHYPDTIKTVATPEEFAHLLKEQNYYASDEASYAAGLKAHLNGPYKDKLKNLGGMAGNVSTSGSSGGPSGGKKKYGGLFGAFDRISDVFSAILNGSDDDGSSGSSSSGGANSPGGALANGGVPANTGLDYMLKNMPGAQVTSNYKDESGRPTYGEHGGIDIAADENTPVPTPVNGTIEDAGTDKGYGNYVQVKDKNGNYHLFGHLNQQKVKTGDSVTKGAIVGLEGSTGISTGPHVHYQIDPPENVNAVKGGPHLDPATYSINGLGKWGLGRLKAKFGKGKWGTGNGAAIWEYLKGKGLGSSAIAGIMGNMQAESSLDPTIVQGGGHADEITVDGQTGYGLCQWTSEGRQQGLKDFAASKGTKSGDLNTQLDFMLKEVGEGYGDLLQRMDGMSPYDAALLFHKEFERSADTAEMAKRRGEYANQIAQSEGKGETFNGTYSGSSSSGKKYKGLFGAFDAIADVFSAIISGDDSSGSSAPGITNGGAAGGHSSDPGIKAATAWANSMTGQQGFGNNGCTEFVKQYLQKAGNPVGQYMADGSQGNLMWVPTLEEWAKEHNMFKPSSAGGAEGDIAITNDHGHVTIADGDGGTWGNSSSQNKILHYKSIADAFGTPDGYIATGSGDGKVSEGASKRSAADMMADGGTSNGWGGSKWGRGGILDFISSAQSSWESIKQSGEQIASLWNPHLRKKSKTTTSTKSLLSKIESAKPKTPIEFRKITDEDIEKIGTASEAIALLRAGSIPLDKISDVNMPKDSDSTDVIRSKLRKIIATIKPEADVDENGLVDGKYEKNDVDYLLNNGYTKEAAIELLSKDPKYTGKKTDLEKKMDAKSFNLDRVKKNFQDRVKQLFHPDEANNNKTTSASNTNKTTTTSTNTSTNNTTGAQAATPAAAQIDYTEKFDTMISLLSTLVQVFTNGATTENATGTGVTTSNASTVHMINNKNIGTVRNEDLAKLFTNINNSMNALASR